jgi:hypothetical protein
MDGKPPNQYQVHAQNSARHSENKMHDDSVAQSLGFAGGLVPGVDIAAYLTQIPVRKWGRRYLESGRLEARFVKPVYETELVVIEADSADDGIAMEAFRGSDLVATGVATLEANPKIRLGDYPVVEGPDHDQRPVASLDELWVGRLLGLRPRTITDVMLADHRESVSETYPIYAGERIVHPGSLLRLVNYTLMENFQLGPWLHIGSKMQMFRTTQAGDELTVRASVVSSSEKKGRVFATLDAIVIADDAHPVAHIMHDVVVLGK